MEYIKYTRDSMKEELRNKRDIKSKFETEKQFQSWCNQKLTKIKQELRILPIKKVRLEGRNENEKPMDVYAPEDYSVMLAGLIIEFDKATGKQTVMTASEEWKVGENLTINDTGVVNYKPKTKEEIAKGIIERLKNRLINQENAVKQLSEQLKEKDRQLKEKDEIIDKFIELGGELV